MCIFLMSFDDVRWFKLRWFFHFPHLCMGKHWQDFKVVRYVFANKCLVKSWYNNHISTGNPQQIFFCCFQFISIEKKLSYNCLMNVNGDNLNVWGVDNIYIGFFYHFNSNYFNSHQNWTINFYFLNCQCVPVTMF